MNLAKRDLQIHKIVNVLLYVYFLLVMCDDFFILSGMTAFIPIFQNDLISAFHGHFKQAKAAVARQFHYSFLDEFQDNGIILLNELQADLYPALSDFAGAEEFKERLINIELVLVKPSVKPCNRYYILFALFQDFSR